MGEMADEAFDRMMDEMDNTGYYRSYGRYRAAAPSRQNIPAKEYKQKRKEPDPKKFDMSFFPSKPKQPIPPKPEPLKSMWDFDDGEEAPF